MEMTTGYGKFLMRAYKYNNKISPSCKSFKEEDIWGGISAATFFLLGTDIAFVVTD